jgi:hypothetical protein
MNQINHNCTVGSAALKPQPSYVTKLSNVNGGELNSPLIGVIL